MSKPHEQHADDRLVAVVTEPSLTDDVPTILTIRPAPGHPFAFLPGSDQEQEGNTAPATEVAATWANLYEAAHHWGSFACTATTLIALASPASAHLFQALGMAFLALSHEESASAHYFLVSNRLRYPPSTVAEGLEQTGVELHEAFVDWTAVGMWLERLANDGHATPHLLETVRPFVIRARTHQQRLWSLLLGVQEEYARLTKHDAARTKEGQA